MDAGQQYPAKSTLAHRAYPLLQRGFGLSSSNGTRTESTAGESAAFPTPTCVDGTVKPLRRFSASGRIRARPKARGLTSLRPRRRHAPDGLGASRASRASDNGHGRSFGGGLAFGCHGSALRAVAGRKAARSGTAGFRFAPLYRVLLVEFDVGAVVHLEFKYPSCQRRLKAGGGTSTCAACGVLISARRRGGGWAAEKPPHGQPRALSDVAANQGAPRPRPKLELRPAQTQLPKAPTRERAGSVT